MAVPVLLAIILVLICCYILYRYQETRRKKGKLKWIREVPGLPIIGPIFEFGDDSRIIGDIPRLIKQYGKLILINIVSDVSIVATDYDFVEFILSKQDILNKSPDYKFLHRWLGTGLLTSDGPKWKKRRRLTTPAFHFSILEEFIDVFEHNLEILVSELSSEISRDSTDIYSFINLYTLDIICETAMGVSINAQINKKSSYVKNVKEVCRISTERSFSILKGSDYLYTLFPDFYRELETVKALHTVTNSVIDARRKELENNKMKVPEGVDEFGRKKKMAFLDILLQSTIDGNLMSREDIREEVDTFMFEGHDTVSSALSFTLYLLATHPEVQKRALEEQKAIFNTEIYRKSTYKDLQSMKYLEIVIKESLRLYPPVPIIGRETDQDIEYKGNIIPKGVSVSIFNYGVLRDPDNFENPDQFDPNRFENNDGTRPYSFIPFSAGPRNCIGQKFAILELKSTLSGLLRHFELLPPEPEYKMILVSEAVLKSRNGVRIKLLKRKY